MHSRFGGLLFMEWLPWVHLLHVACGSSCHGSWMPWLRLCNLVVLVSCLFLEHVVELRWCISCMYFSGMFIYISRRHHFSAICMSIKGLSRQTCNPNKDILWAPILCNVHVNKWSIKTHIPIIDTTCAHTLLNTNSMQVACLQKGWNPSKSTSFACNAHAHTMPNPIHHDISLWQPLLQATFSPQPSGNGQEGVAVGASQCNSTMQALLGYASIFVDIWCVF